MAPPAACHGKSARAWRTAETTGSGLPPAIRAASSGSDSSDGRFSITGADPHPVPTLSVTRPSAGESVPIGTVHSVSWSTTATGGTLYATLPGQHLCDVPGCRRAAGTFDWYVCSPFGPGGDYNIRMYGYDECGRYLPMVWLARPSPSCRRRHICTDQPQRRRTLDGGQHPHAHLDQQQSHRHCLRVPVQKRRVWQYLEMRVRRPVHWRLRFAGCWRMAPTIASGLNLTRPAARKPIPATPRLR